MISRKESRPAGRSDWKPKLVFLLVAVFLALIVLGACRGDFGEVQRNGTAL